ncbi:MAG TPA: sigma-54-dependent Fis family transcriptional regulator [Desulfomonilaceae bacterium]|nr:sigma-54-dependent Fis family transcriptional regulator [Desulfomonilaceae bacterium]
MSEIDELRKRAEASMTRGRRVARDDSETSTHDLDSVVHELRVHQIELEMQNHELRKTQEELEEAQASYQELYEFAPTPYFTLDTNGFIIRVNIAGSRLLRYGHSLMTNVPFSKFVHPGDAPTFLSHIGKVFQDGGRQVCEVRLKSKLQEMFVRLESVGAQDSDGKVTVCRTIATDLTERRRSEEALERSEGLFRAICENTDEIIFIKDLEGQCTYANPATERLFQVSKSQLIGRPCEKLLAPDGGHEIEQRDRRVVEGETIEEERRRTVNGLPMTFLETRIPVRDKRGKVSGVLFHARDITDRKLDEIAPPTEQPGYRSAVMQATLKMAAMVAQKNTTILLLGESGSGKDYLAKYIHDHSPRSSGPYFSINCAALPPELAESELFGHEKGSFTGAAARKRGLLELAEGGTLLLNEIGELSKPLQAKLLTFLDTKQFTRVGGEKHISVNARLITATNRNLAEEVQAGRFREDLFYRLNVVPVEVPPLRERKEDIPVLVQEILERIQRDMQLPVVPPITSAMMKSFMNYDWPGNVRELRNVLERALILSGKEPLSLKNLGIAGAVAGDDDWAITTTFPSGQSLNDILADLKRSLIEEALLRSGGRRQDAARLLGVSRYSLKHHMKSLDMMDKE